MKSRISFLLLLSLCLALLLSSCGFSNYNLPTDFSSVELIYENDPSRYYYNQLTDNGKTAYTLIVNNISEHPEKIEIQTVNEVDFEEAKRKNAMGKTRMRRCRKAFTDC